MRLGLASGIVVLGVLAGCGTTYEIPKASDPRNKQSHANV